MENLNQVKRVFEEEYILMENKEWKEVWSYDEVNGEYNVLTSYPKSYYTAGFLLNMINTEMDLNEIMIVSYLTKKDTIYEFKDGTTKVVSSRKFANFKTDINFEEYPFAKVLGIHDKWAIEISSNCGLSNIIGKIMNETNAKVDNFIKIQQTT